MAVALSVSDDRQLTAEPEAVLFSAANASFDVVIAVRNDIFAEPEKTFTVSLAPQADIPAMVSTELSIIVPADDDTPTAFVFAERTVIPEGATVSVLIDAYIRQDLTVSMAASGPADIQGKVTLSPPSLTLSPNDSRASFSISVADDKEPQPGDRTFNVGMAAMPALQSELATLTFTVPPNDLRAHAAMRAEFTLENERDTQAMTIDITPSLQGGKRFLVFSEDPRLIVNTGLVARARSPFPVELALREGFLLGKEELLSLSVAHLDGWRQRSAQAQLGAADRHSCAVKEDNTVICWGSDAANRSSPTSSPQVNADTGFLSVSAGSGHSCGIKEDNTVACWGLNDRNQANPMSSPQGVDADTKFLAVSARAFHSCGVKADGAVACWGLNNKNQSNPTSSPQGVNVGSRFLAVSVGYEHTCAIRLDNTLACWGDNDNSQATR